MDSSKLMKTGKKTQKVFEKLKTGMDDADFEIKEDGTCGLVGHKMHALMCRQEDLGMEGDNVA